MLILALDLGLSNSAYHLLDSVTGEFEEGKLATRPARLVKLFEKHSADLVVMEAGPLAAWVYDLAAAAGRRVLVADTTDVVWSWRLVKRKTDRDDARKLARLASHNQLRPVHVPAATVRAWRSLILHRQRIARDLKQQRHRIRGLLVREALFLPAGSEAWSATGVRYLWGESRGLGGCALAGL